QAEIYFVKDIALIAAYTGFVAAGQPSGPQLMKMRPLPALLVLSLAYFGIELMNLNSPSLLVSIAGLKNYILYMPLAFIVPYIFSSREDLELKLRTYAILMIPFVALGLVQFAFPPDHWINGYLSHEGEELNRGIQFVGFMHTRTSGTFSY